MGCDDGSISQDLVLQVRSTTGEERIVALTEAIKFELNIVGKHFGNVIAVPVSEIEAAVSIVTGLDIGLDLP